jgi:Flp pilus assembly protein TadD
MLFAKRGEPDHAAACYAQALRIAPGYADAAANLGTVSRITDCAV